jgi:hypothetical protein
MFFALSDVATTLCPDKEFAFRQVRQTQVICYFIATDNLGSRLLHDFEEQKSQSQIENWVRRAWKAIS